MIRRPPRSPLFPSTTLFRSVVGPRRERDLEQRASLELDARPEPADREEEHAGDDQQRREQEVPPLALDKVERSEEHTSELQSPCNLVCRLLLEKKKQQRIKIIEIAALSNPIRVVPSRL